MLQKGNAFLPVVSVFLPELQHRELGSHCLGSKMIFVIIESQKQERKCNHSKSPGPSLVFMQGQLSQRHSQMHPSAILIIKKFSRGFGGASLMQFKPLVISAAVGVSASS